MAYDEVLAGRLREIVRDDLDVTEKRMFGGLAFLASGNMAVAVSGAGGLMVRVDPDESETLVAADGVERMVMKGRAMNGWLLVQPEVVADDAPLRDWAERGLDVARSLPAK